MIYDSIGAGAARSRLSAELPTIDFADTSAAPPEQEYINNASLGLQVNQQSRSRVVYLSQIFPVVAGPIVLVYNLPLPKNVSSQVVFSRENLYDIFTGTGLCALC